MDEGVRQDEQIGDAARDDAAALPHFTETQAKEQGLLTTAAMGKLVDRKPRSILNWVEKQGLRPAGRVMIGNTRTFVFRESDVRDFMRDKGYEGRWARHAGRETGPSVSFAGVPAVASVPVGAGVPVGPVVVEDDAAVAARMARGMQEDAGGDDALQQHDITAEMLLDKGGVNAYVLLEALIVQSLPVLNRKLDDKTSSFDIKQHSTSVASLLEQIKRLQTQVEKQAQRSGDIVPLALAQEMVTRFCQATVSQCEALQRELVLSIMEAVAPALDAAKDASVVRREVTVRVEQAVRTMREKVTASVSEASGNAAAPGGEKHAA